MCGISGAFSKYDLSHEDRLVVSDMVSLQVSRGPDNSSVVYDKKVCLGHNRLKIIDLSDSANQPTQGDRYILSFNGEIYNYLTLKEELTRVYQKEFSTTSDTEVLLKCFEQYGVNDTLSKIDGMFAIALYDKVYKKLYLIRDRLGEKPLYYFFDQANKIVFFASNLKAIFVSLFRIKGQRWRVNYSAIYHYLLTGGFWEGESIISGVRKLKSANYLSVDCGNFSLNYYNYWKPKRSRIDEDNYSDFITNSIKKNSVADVRPALLFSGGIDSSLIGACMPGITGMHLESPEEEAAEKIAEKLSINFKKVTPSISVDNKKYIGYISEYVGFSGEPSGSSLITMIAMDSIKGSTRLVFTGNGGDEVFYGYRRTPIIRPDLNESDLARLENFQVKKMFRDPELFAVKGVDALSIDDIKKYIYNYEQTDIDDPEVKYRWAEINFYVKNVLNPTLDFSSMKYSIEVRAPFLDHNLVEKFLSLSSGHHTERDFEESVYKNKILLKNILRKKIGVNLTDKKKYGFSLSNSFREGASQLLDDYLNLFAERGVVSLSNIDEASFRDRLYLKKSIISLEVWFQQYVDTGIVSL